MWTLRDKFFVLDAAALITEAHRHLLRSTSNDPELLKMRDTVAEIVGRLEMMEQRPIDDVKTS